MCARHADGTFLKHACALEGGTYKGLVEAMERDESIAAQVHEAHAKGVEKYRALKASAMPGEDDWKKWAWDLERFDREAFAPPTSKVDAVVKDERSSDETLALVATVVLGVKREGGE